MYKIQSRNVLDDRLLDQLFLERSDILRYKWNAYPILSPQVESAAFELSESVFWVNAMERFVSSVEMEIVASRNVATLLHRKFSGDLRS